MSEISLEAIEQLLDRKLAVAVAPLATKEDLKEQTEALARMIADTIAGPFTQRLDRLEQLLSIEQDVETLKREVIEIRSALHLSST